MRSLPTSRLWAVEGPTSCCREPIRPGAKRFHFDLQVNDLDQATESLCGIGASQPDFQPGAGRWRVLLDPDGQPFR
ncbi:MAG: VOC family protein [Actinomycetota bacterium]|nr:VOC family protein [Actinomycetota bacterium]